MARRASGRTSHCAPISGAARPPTRGSPAADKISQHRIASGDVAALLALIERKRIEAEATLLRPVRVMSCYEAGYDGFWLHRLLCDQGSDNRVLDAASILVDRRFRRKLIAWILSPCCER